MKLAALLQAIEQAPGAVTVSDLARRLQVTPAVVTEMLAALRASGRLGPDAGSEPGTQACATTGSCGLACSGPVDCPFTVDLGSTLEIRRR